MARLLQRSGNATAIPYNFCPGNHEVRRLTFPWSAQPDSEAQWLCSAAPPEAWTTCGDTIVCDLRLLSCMPSIPRMQGFTRHAHGKALG